MTRRPAPDEAPQLALGLPVPRYQLTRLGLVAAVYEGKCAAHPELRRPLSWRALQRICAREQIGLKREPIDEDATLAGFRGRWTIIVNSDTPPRRHTYYAAHELAHLWMHVDQEDGRGALVFNFGSFEGGDPREDDAECLATMLCQGPRLL